MPDVYAVAKYTMRLSDPAWEYTVPTPLCYSDNNANGFAITLLNEDGSAAVLSGYSISGTFVRPDDVDVTLTGAINGNVATAILSDGCYRAAGRFLLTIKLLQGSAVIRTLAIIRGRTIMDAAESHLDPEHIMPSPEELIAEAQAAIAAMEAQKDQVLASIPSDYTELSNQVDGLSNAMRDTANGKNLMPIDEKAATYYGVTSRYANGRLTLTGACTHSGGTLTPLTPWFTLEPGSYVMYCSPVYYGSFILLEKSEPQTSNVVMWSDGRVYTTTTAKTVCLTHTSFRDGTTYNNEYFIALERNAATEFHFPSEPNAVDQAARDDIATLQTTVEQHGEVVEDVPYKVPYPLVSGNIDYGVAGQVLATDGNGNMQWTNAGTPTEEQIAENISAWLEEHPEAVTTVQDGSIAERHMAPGGPGFVTPEMYGAVGDGVTDDTEAVVAAFNQLSYNTVVLRKHYKIKATPSAYRVIHVRSGMTVLFCGATLELYSDAQMNTNCIIEISGVHDVSLLGHGTLIGTKTSGVAFGEWCFGLAISNSQRVIVSGLFIKDCWSDGICLEGSIAEYGYYSSDIIIRNVTTDNCGRNGIAVVSAENVLIDGCTCTNTSGNGVGIDCEANGYHDRMNNITITNCLFKDNTRMAINFYVPYNHYTVEGSSVVDGASCNAIVSNCIMDGVISFYASGNYSSLHLSNCKITPSSPAGSNAPYALSFYTDATSHIDVANCTLMLTNSGTGAINFFTPNFESRALVRGNVVMANTYVYDQAYAPISGIQAKTSERIFQNESIPVSTSWTYSGESITLSKPALIRIFQNYNGAMPSGCGLGFNSTSFSGLNDIYDISDSAVLTSYCPQGTYYIWLKANGSGSNNTTCEKTEFENMILV